MAYEVESDSAGNAVYLLLNNTNSAASFDAVSLSENSPAFVTTTSTTIAPSTIAPQTSELAALEFYIAPGTAVGTTGNMVITVSGTVNGQAHEVYVPVALEVVTLADGAQGVVGTTIPVADEGGVDTDGDGISDVLEIAFGSDAFWAGSVPGTVLEARVPMLGTVGNIVLAMLLVFMAWYISRQGLSAARLPLALLLVTSVVTLPQNAFTGDATRIQLLVDISAPPALPPPAQLAAVGLRPASLSTVTWRRAGDPISG